VGVGARFCDYDLRTVEVYDVDADLVRVQQFITELCERYFLAPDSTLTITGVEVTATIAFDAICELLDESLDILTPFTPGYDRTKLTQALRDCNTILSSPTATDAARTADDIGLLNPGGPITPIGPDNAILRRPRNPLLAAIRNHALTPSLSPPTQLMLGCGSRWPRYPIREAENDRTWLRLPEHHPELPEPTPAWIPQVLWPNTIWRSSSTAPPDIEAAAQAMALAKMGDVRSWTVIALDLGLPKDMSTPVTRYWRHIVPSGRWGEALASLTALREHLRRRPLITSCAGSSPTSPVASLEPSTRPGSTHRMWTNTTSTMWCADSGSTSPVVTSPMRRRPTRCRPPNFSDGASRLRL
jgi:hypothetical protein